MLVIQGSASSCPCTEPNAAAGIPAKSGPAKGQLDPLRLRRVLNYIEQNWNLNVPIAELAAIACLSPYHFIRRFHRATGCPPYRYQLTLRIEHAKAVLLQPGRTILDIALECGFSSQASFSRAFRKQTGMSPAIYRTSSTQPR